jgi:hypothetical protein
MVDSQLIKALKSKCKKNISFIDEIASILEINYDAAYRRVNGKTAISLNEAVILSRYFKVSLNQIYSTGEPNELIITKTKEISNAIQLEKYFLRLSRDLSLLDNENSSIFYSAKDLPIFYVLQDDLLSRFKIYTWLYILDKDIAKKNIPFEDFKIPYTLLQAAQKAGKAYNNVKITELWNYGIINSIVNQITYFFETKLLSYNSALKVTEDLKKIIKEIEESAYLGKRYNKKQTGFKLYHNELLTLNNNIIIKAKNQKTLISPYSLLRYYKIEDQATCNAFEQFLHEQISISKLLSKTGVKERILFFKPKYNQIDKLINRINLLNQFPI